MTGSVAGVLVTNKFLIKKEIAKTMKLNTLFDSDYNEESRLMADQSENELSQVNANDWKHKFKTDEADPNCFLKTSPQRASQLASRLTSMEAPIHRDG